MRKFIFILLCFAISTALANQLPIKALQKCCRNKYCIEYPIRNSELFIVMLNHQSDNQFFVHTDKNGFFYLDDAISNKVAMVYLANENQIILAGCYSDFTRTHANEVILDGLCPMDNCKLA